ncbi:hypothetical protein J6590_062296 [Homalodisca vitripennis]|nr:hypothetical protein J6590_062296 [Homalodisca vitripennis]
MYIFPGEIRAKKPSLTLNLKTNGLKMTSKPPPMAGQAGPFVDHDIPDRKITVVPAALCHWSVLMVL